MEDLFSNQVTSYLSEDVRLSLSTGFQKMFSSFLESFEEEKIKNLLFDKITLKILASMVLQAEHDLTSSSPLLPSTEWIISLNGILNLCKSALNSIISNQDNNCLEGQVANTHLFCKIIFDTVWNLWKLGDYLTCEKFITDVSNDFMSHWITIIDSDSSSTFMRELVQKLTVSLIALLQKLELPGDSKVTCTFTKTVDRFVLFSLEILKRGNPLSTPFAILYFLPLIVRDRNPEVAKEMFEIVNSLYGEVDDELVEIKTTSLTVLCSLWDICYPVEGTALFPLDEDERFWRIVQFGLAHDNPSHRKRSRYLMTRALDRCNSSNVLVSVSKRDGRVIFYWDPKQAHEAKQLWNDFLILMEVLEEKQVHLVKPLLNKVEGIIKAILYSRDSLPRLDVSWLLLLLKRMLIHGTSFTPRWALATILNLNVKDAPELAMPILKYFFCHFLPFLNDPDIFARENEMKLGSFPTMADALTKFLENYHGILKFPQRKAFLVDLSHRITKHSWSGVALFYVSWALASLRPTPALGGKELHALRAHHNKNVATYQSFVLAEIKKKLVLNAQGTQEPLIRGAIQCNILRIVVNLSDPSEVSYNDLSRFITTLKSSECFERSTVQWQETVTWLSQELSASSDEDASLLGVTKARIFCNNSVYDLENDDDEGSGELNEECQRITRMLLILDDAARLDCSHQTDAIVDDIREDLRRITEVIVTAPERPYVLVKKVETSLKLCVCLFNESEARHSRETKVPKQDIAKYLEMKLLPYMNTVAPFLIQKLISSKTLEELGTYKTALETFLSRLELNLCLIPCMNVLFKLHDNPTEVLGSWICLEIIVTNLQPEWAREFVCCEKLRDLLEIPKRLGSSPVHKQMAAMAISSAWKCFSIYHRLSPFDFSTSFSLLFQLAERTFEIVSSQAVVNVLHCLKHVFTNTDLGSQDVQDCLDSGWKACMELRKNEYFRPALQAFVAAAFQPSLMTKFTTYLLEKAEQLFVLGETSTGICNILVKQCISVCSNQLCLSTIQDYISILCISLIFGPVHRKDQRIAQNTSAFICEQTLSVNELVASNHYVDSEVRVLAIKYLLSLCPCNDHHRSLASAVVYHLLTKEKQITNSRPRHFANSYIHRAKTRAWQAILIINPLLTEECRKAVLTVAYEALMQENQQPSVRYLLEWLAALILHKEKAFVDDFPRVLERAANQRVGCVSSFLSIMVLLARILPPKELEERLVQWLPLILPWCMMQHFNTRIYAQVALGTLWRIAEKNQLTVVLDRYIVLKQCTELSDSCGNAARACKQLSEEFYFTVFHPIRHYSLETIFYELPRLSNLTDEDWIPLHLFDGCFSEQEVGNGFLTVESLELSLKNIQPSKWVQGDTIGYENPSENFQKKITPWKMMVPDEQAMHEINKKDVKSGGLVVLASLIDRPPNLGGLCRTCEIFGVSEYIIGNLKYMDDPQFKNLSVSAERWINIKEVKPHQLKEYMLEMKAQGYTLVGVEQTANSQNLLQFKFPEKTLLLLGNEKEGIPVELLHLLDTCVEIPQQGIIRSLNVHVSGALFVWEYTRQHCK